MPACPTRRGPLSRRPGNGPFGPLDRNPKSQIVLIGEPRLARDPKRLRGTPNCPPILPDAHPPSVTPASPGWARRGRLPTVPLCSPVCSSPRVPATDPGSPRPPVPLFVALHLVSSPSPPPQQSSAGPPLGSLPVPSPEDPHAQNTPSHPPRPAHRPAAVFASTQPL